MRLSVVCVVCARVERIVDTLVCGRRVGIPIFLMCTVCDQQLLPWSAHGMKGYCGFN